jgi:precorrin-6B methylase 2
MDRNKFSQIGHRDHEFYNPITKSKIEKILSLANLKPSDKVVDIGSGKCEILIRLIEKYSIIGTGIELYEGFVSQAQQNAAGRIDKENLILINKDAKEGLSQSMDTQYDMAMCIGSTHALGGFEPTLIELKKCVKDGGYIVIGEGYWKVKPSSEYLKALGAEESELNSHYGNIKLAEDLGLISLWSSVASEDDWDEYECLYSMSIENYCYENSEDEDCEEMLKKIRAWRSTYFSMGRDTLGFGLYLFRNIK